MPPKPVFLPAEVTKAVAPSACSSDRPARRIATSSIEIVETCFGDALRCVACCPAGKTTAANITPISIDEFIHPRVDHQTVLVRNRTDSIGA